MALPLTPLCTRPQRREGEAAPGSELPAAPLLGPPQGTGARPRGAGADPLPGDPPTPRGDLLRGSRDLSSPGGAVV